jgi:hypothetical protein
MEKWDISNVRYLVAVQIRTFLYHGGPGVAWWLRHCATSRKVPGSILDAVTGNFFCGIRESNVRGVDSASKNEDQDIPGGKDGQCVWLTTYYLQVPKSWNVEALTSQNPLGPIGL